MPQINSEILERITQRTGLMNAMLARLREVNVQIAAIASHPLLDIHVIVVPTSGPQFPMRVPVAVLRALAETNADALSRDISAHSGVPLDWIPDTPSTGVAAAASPNSEGTPSDV